MGRCPSASGWSRKSKGVVTAGQAGWLLPCGICDYFLDLVWFLTNSFTCYMYMRYSTTIAFVYLEKREIVEMYLDLPWGFQTSGRENRYSLCIPFVFPLCVGAQTSPPLWPWFRSRRQNCHGPGYNYWTSPAPEIYKKTALVLDPVECYSSNK